MDPLTKATRKLDELSFLALYLRNRRFAKSYIKAHLKSWINALGETGTSKESAIEMISKALESLKCKS